MYRIKNDPAHCELATQAMGASPVPAVDELSAWTENDVLCVQAKKRVSIHDPYMPAHFPGRTIFPGVFIIECARHAFRAAILETYGVVCELSTVGSVRFLAPLVEGDVLTLQGRASAVGSHFEAEADGWCRDAEHAVKLRLIFQVSVP